ncbi:phage tail protein [Salmonella enterica]|nr:phage tail protein [Salmonella enterica]
MIKRKLLREFLLRTVTWLNQNPEKLNMDIDEGRISSSLAPSLSHRHHYTLSMWITDWSGDTITLLSLINLWLRRHEPDIFATDEARKTGFRYWIQEQDSTHSTVNIRLQLTERTIVEIENGVLTATSKGEIPLPAPEQDILAAYLDEQGEG